jgi:hypothetical protein
MANQEDFDAEKARLDRQHEMGLISKGEHTFGVLAAAAKHGLDHDVSDDDIERMHDEFQDRDAAMAAGKERFGENAMGTKEGQDFILRNFHDRRGERG